MSRAPRPPGPAMTSGVRRAESGAARYQIPRHPLPHPPQLTLLAPGHQAGARARSTQPAVTRAARRSGHWREGQGGGSAAGRGPPRARPLRGSAPERPRRAAPASARAPRQGILRRAAGVAAGKARPFPGTACLPEGTGPGRPLRLPSLTWPRFHITTAILWNINTC